MSLAENVKTKRKMTQKQKEKGCQKRIDGQKIKTYVN